MRRALLLSLALPLLLGNAVEAQTCVGMPSFSTGRMQVSAGGAFADGASSVGGNFGYGTPKGLYGKAGIGSTSYDAYDASSFDLNLGGGYQIPLQTTRTAELCPVASLSLGSGPNDVLGSTDISSRTFAFGAAAGVVLGHNPQMRILPNASFQFANTHTSLDDGAASVSGSESYAVVTLGTGFVFNSRYSLNPSLSFPIGLDGSSAAFGLAGAIQFGR